MPAGYPEESREGPDVFQRPFRKTLVDVYDYLALGVAANVTILVMVSAAASVGLILVHASQGIAVAASLGAIALLTPALAWGVNSLAIAMARREEPSYWRLFAGFGRRYPHALAYLALGVLGAGLVSFMAWFWSHAPIWGGSFELAVAAMWLGVGVLGACAHTLGWPVLVLSDGRVLYALRVALALLAVSPRTALGFLGCCIGLALVPVLPVVGQWRGLGAGICVMFTVFLGVFCLAMLTANVALSLIGVLSTRQEASDSAENTQSTEEEFVDD